MRFEKITIGVDMAGCPNRCKHCWIGHFKNEKLIDIRVIEDELCYIPEKYHKGFGKTERVLYEELIDDESVLNLTSKTPVFYITSEFDVYPNYTEISSVWYLGNLKNDGIEKILNNYINNKSLGQKYRNTIPINEMVREYGNPESNKLFDKEDYITYILNQYCRNLI